MPESALYRLVFETPIGPRQRSLGEILGRKTVKKGLREMLGISGDRDRGRQRRKRADVEEPNVALAKMALLNMVAKMAAIEKEAPFKSKAQRRKFYAMASRGEISKAKVKKWEAETPKGKKLPERIHRKAAGEKEAILGALLVGAGKTLFNVGSKVVSGTAKAGLGLGRRLLAPKTFLGRRAADLGWAGIAGGAAAGGHQPMMPMQPRMAAVVDYLLDLTKESFEIRGHSPASTDTAEPIVKKNSMSKSSAAAGLSLGTAAFRPTPVSTSVRSSSTVNPGKAWLGRSSTTLTHHAKPAGPPSSQVGGEAPVSATPAMGGGHIQSGGVRSPR